MIIGAVRVRKRKPCQFCLICIFVELEPKGRFLGEIGGTFRAVMDTTLEELDHILGGQVRRASSNSPTRHPFAEGVSTERGED